MTMSEQNALWLQRLPDLPQADFLKELAARLWARTDVLALWLGGSFASGRADRYSDVDLRIAVPVDVLPSWDRVRLYELVGERAIWSTTTFMAEDSALHHLLLDNGEAYDVWMQTSQREPHREPKLVLGCRDEALADMLAQPGVEERLHFEPADPAEIQGLIERYWSNHVKNEKVLYRRLHLLMRDGMYLFGGTLMRLQFVLATGQDCGDVYFPKMTIHTITPVLQVLEAHYGDSVRTTLGLPTRTVGEVVAAIERLDDDVAQAGQQLAQKLDFSYPHQLEATVRQSWSRFKVREASSLNLKFAMDHTD